MKIKRRFWESGEPGSPDYVSVAGEFDAICKKYPDKADELREVLRDWSREAAKGRLRENSQMLIQVLSSWFKWMQGQDEEAAQEVGKIIKGLLTPEERDQLERRQSEWRKEWDEAKKSEFKDRLVALFRLIWRNAPKYEVYTLPHIFLDVEGMPRTMVVSFNVKRDMSETEVLFFRIREAT